MPSLDYQILYQLRDKFTDYPCFIETGTHKGETIFQMESYFKQLYTIEYSEKYYTTTKGKYIGNKIDFLLGDSSVVFETLLPKIQEKTIFFLDGHWSSGDTGRSEKDCPLIEEITHIQNLFVPSAILIIDDYRMFGKGPCETQSEDWTSITKDKIIDILNPRIIDIYCLDSSICKNDRLILHICGK